MFTLECTRSIFSFPLSKRLTFTNQAPKWNSVWQASLAAGFFFFFWMGERVGHTPRTEPVIIGGTFIPNLCLWMRDAKIQQMGTQSAALYFSVSGEQERGWGLELRELPGRWQKRASPWGLRPRQEAVLGRLGGGGSHL